jgi:hypothetical protein
MYCTLTDGTNPWNAVYKIAGGQNKSPTILTTIQKQDGTFTEDTVSTLKYMLDYFSPGDNENSDSKYHQKVRKLSKEPLETEDDRIFSQEEILAVLKKFDPKKAPGEDGRNSEMLLRVYRYFPLSLTDIYNECLTRGFFPNQWKRSIIVPIVKPGKDNSKEPSKYRPISLINVGGKVLEKLLIDSILHHVYSNNLLNKDNMDSSLKKVHLMQ